jgi:carbamoyl-phosphate synthase large subunit
MLREYVAKAVGVTPDRHCFSTASFETPLKARPTRFPTQKMYTILAVMEHVGACRRSLRRFACVIPPVSIDAPHLETIKDYTRKIAKALKVCGLRNMQYAIEDGRVYVLEANPRASRTVPLVSKVCNTQMARLATKLMLGGSLSELKLKDKVIPHYGAKEAVFPYDKFPEVIPY